MTSPTGCGHWPAADGGPCGTTAGVRRYLVGPRCPAHTPAALDGRPQPPTGPAPTSTRIRRYEQGSPTVPGVAALAAALDYAARGWPVFLLGRSKRPVANCPDCAGAGPDHDRAGCDCLTCHGFYAASTDPDRITAMFAAVPGGLLAIRTGAASGLVVVDIDPRNGGRLDPALMPPTAAVATGGGGWHLYYTHPGQPVPCTTLPDRAGVDIKADGGYVLAPPSTHPGTGRRYRWVGGRPVVEMPPALLDHLTAPPPPPVAPPPAPTTTTAGAGGISSAPALLAAHLRAVQQAQPGSRRTTLYGAARGVARMVAAGAITPTQARQALYAAGRAAEQTDRDIRAAITGGFHAEGVAA